ncbi:MAG: zinc-ribbon domain containing protein [Deltaproteobacteria bacterium]|nr:zinc-ribbon domain containing protein [Deltaproteobacteria bacterium]
MEDITIGCIQCGHEFVFTASEQRQYRNRNFSNPRRCPECRKKKAKLSNTDQNSKNRNNKDAEMYW